MKLLESGEPVNQNALKVSDKEFSALFENGDIKTNQRYTVHYEKTPVVDPQELADHYDQLRVQDVPSLAAQDSANEFAADGTEAVPYVLNAGEAYVYHPREVIGPDGVKTMKIVKWKTTGKVDEETGKKLSFSLLPQQKDGKVGILQKGLSESTLSDEKQAEYKEQYEAALSAEKQKTLDNPGYDIAAKDMIEHAESADETEIFYMSQAFIDAILKSVERGDVTLKGETADVEKFKAQLQAMLKQYKLPIEKREQKNPFVYIPSAGGMRDAFKMLFANEAIASRLGDVIKDIEFKDKSPKLANPQLDQAPQEGEPGKTPEAETAPKTAKQKVDEIENIELKRAIQEYASLMSHADFMQRVNGDNMDSRLARDSAEKRIGGIPSAMRELARDFYSEEKQSQ